MNIFYLDKDPVRAAQYQVDKHVVKMPLETAQMLCSAYEVGTAPYRRTHYNHPSTVWSRSSKANYEWLIAHGMALCAEYTFRYGKTHKSQSIIEWCRDNMHLVKFQSESFTPPPQCMPDDAKKSDSVSGYRSYYNTHKSYIFNWTKRNPPEWVSA